MEDSHVSKFMTRFVPITHQCPQIFPPFFYRHLDALLSKFLVVAGAFLVKQH